MGCAILGPANPKQFFFSWLVSFMFFLSLAVGALFFVLIQWTTEKVGGFVRARRHAPLHARPEPHPA